VSRLLSGDTVSEEFHPPEDEEYPALAIETAEYIAQSLESVFHIKVSDIERAYICIHLVGFNAISPEHPANAVIPERIKKLATAMIMSVDSQLGTVFISDELLFFDLCFHLKATVFRLQKDIYHKKTSRFQLSDSNIHLYTAASSTSGLYSEICGVSPDEEELLSVTCYLLLSLHRNMRKLKALLICNGGITKRMELMAFIGNMLPLADIADCCTIYQLKLITISDYDFIISMEDMQPMEKPAVDLSKTERSDYAGLIFDFLEKTGFYKTLYSP
jgi:mannitol operon transcriptional antiterminator